jgi:apolipoprotein N-acyltransferase
MFATQWTIAEWFLGHLLMGLPWVSVRYTWLWPVSVLQILAVKRGVRRKRGIKKISLLASSSKTAQLLSLLILMKAASFLLRPCLCFLSYFLSFRIAGRSNIISKKDIESEVKFLSEVSTSLDENP